MQNDTMPTSRVKSANICVNDTITVKRVKFGDPELLAQTHTHSTRTT